MVERQEELPVANRDELCRAVTNGDRSVLLRWIDGLKEEEASTLLCKEIRGQLLQIASHHSASMIWHILSTGKFSGDLAIYNYIIYKLL